MNTILRLPLRLLRRLSRVFKRDERAFLRSSKRLLHIGANEGQECELYARLGLDVLWVEAIPEVYSKLKEKVSAFNAQNAVQALLTDKDGETYEFNVASNQGASSSIFEFKEHGRIWPEIEYVRKEKLVSKRLDTLLTEQGLQDVAFDTAVLDVQGAELLVLKGFGKHLNSLKFAQCEAADFESYSGACQVDDLYGFMTQNGFRLRKKTPFAGKQGVGSYFELLFEKL